MAIALANVDSTTDTFDQWLDKTNQTLNAFTNYAVTVDSSVHGAYVAGNGTVNGHLYANTLSANTLRGGNVSTSANLLLVSAMFSNNTINANTFGVATGIGGITGTFPGPWTSANLVITTGVSVNGTITANGLNFSNVSQLVVASNADLGADTSSALPVLTINAVSTPVAKLTVFARRGSNTEISEVVLASNAAASGTNDVATVLMTVFGTVAAPATANVGVLSATQTGNTVSLGFTQSGVSSSIKILATLFTY